MGEKKIKAAYEVADENSKKVLLKLFPEILNAKTACGDIRDKVKSYADACRILGVNQVDKKLPDDIKAYIKLRTICEALNEGWYPSSDNTWYYPYLCFYTEKDYEELSDEDKRGVLVGGGAYCSAAAGFGCVLTYNAPTTRYANFGSRLCLRSEELAEYCGKQFLRLWIDYYTA